MTLWAFNRPFRILGCDKFTHDYYLEKYQKKFPIGGFEDAPTKDKSSIFLIKHMNIHHIMDGVMRKTLQDIAID